MDDPPNARVNEALRHWCGQLYNVVPVRESLHAALIEIGRTFYPIALYPPPQHSRAEWELDVQVRLYRMNRQAAETLKRYKHEPVAENGPPEEVRTLRAPAQELQLQHQALDWQPAQRQHHITPERSEARISALTLRADGLGSSGLRDSEGDVAATTMNKQAAPHIIPFHHRQASDGIGEENNGCRRHRKLSQEQAVEKSSDRLSGIEAPTGEGSAQLGDSASASRRPSAVLTEEEGPLPPRKRTPWRVRNLDEEEQNHQPRSILAHVPQNKAASTVRATTQTPLFSGQSIAMPATITRSSSRTQPMPPILPESDSAISTQRPPPSNLESSVTLSTDDQRTVIDRGCPHHFAGYGVWNQDKPVCPEEGCQEFHICKPWWLSLKEPEKQHPGCPHGGENIKHWDSDLREAVLHVRPSCKRTLLPYTPMRICENTAEKPCAYGHDHADLRRAMADTAKRWKDARKSRGREK